MQDYKAPGLILGPVVGLDFSGVVTAVGPGDVGQLKVGDAVFGNANGSLAEYTVAKASEVALKPDWLSFEEAAALPIAYLTSLQVRMQ